jgi:hypothetical protein
MCLPGGGREWIKWQAALKQRAAWTLHSGGTHQDWCPTEFGPNQGRHTPKNHDIHKQKNVNFRHEFEKKSCKVIKPAQILHSWI